MIYGILLAGSFSRFYKKNRSSLDLFFMRPKGNVSILRLYKEQVDIARRSARLECLASLLLRAIQVSFQVDIG